MAIAKGVSKQSAYKKETTWGTVAGNTGGKLLRRVTTNFNLTKDTYESAEIRTDYQIADMRHGVRKAEGALNGELSAGSYSDFMQAILARDFTTVTAISGLSATIATSGSLYTVTRATGSWITDGVQVGQVLRLTGAGLNVANVAKNILVAGMTATVLTVAVPNGLTLVAEGPIATVTATVVGKVTYVPTTGHTDQSFTFEEWYSDIAQSEVYTGVKVGTMAVQLPSTGLSTVDLTFMGKDLTQTGTSQYFTTPTAQTTTGIFAAVNGMMLVAGQPVALITSADFSIERAMENAVAVGSNSSADIFTGRIKVTGNMSVYFQDAAFRGYFDNETPVSLVFLLMQDSTANSDFVSFVIPKAKINSFTKEDKELGLTASASFQGLLNSTVTGGLPATTVAIQDSTLT